MSAKITQHPWPHRRFRRRAVVLCACLSLPPAACVSPGDERSAPSTVILGTTRPANEWYLGPIWNVTAQHDPPLAYLFPNVQTSVVHRRIRGLASPFRANIAEYLHQLWIEDER